MSNKTKVLFVIHESRRTGAPLIIISIIKELSKNRNLLCDVLVKQSGELDSELSRLGYLYHFYPKYLSSPKFFNKLMREVIPVNFGMRCHQAKLEFTLKKRKYDVVYFNSLGCLEVFPFFNSFKIKKVTHIHELKKVVDSLGDNIASNIIESSDVLISSYRSVSKFIKSDFPVSINKLIENSVFLSPDHKTSIDNLGLIKKDRAEFIIGACGGVEERKGTDIFVDFAIQILNSDIGENLKFIWVGEHDNKLGALLINKVRHFGFGDRIVFTGVSKEPARHFVNFDIFFLSSREEAFGIVGLENAYCENPLIAFDIEGDLPMFITKYDCGYVIPQFDYASFYTAIAELIENKEKISELGKRGRYAVENDFSIEPSLEAIKEAIGI